MTWTTTLIEELEDRAQDLGIVLAEEICRNLDLGNSIDKDIEYLYFVHNIVFSIETAITDTLTDDQYTYLSECIDRIETQRNKFRNTI